jgi:hypothetical protein
MPKHDEAYRQLVLRHALGISWARMLHDQHLAGIGRAGNANFTSPDRVRQEADWFVQAVERASAFWIDPDIAEFIQGAANGFPADLPLSSRAASRAVRVPVVGRAAAGAILRRVALDTDWSTVLDSRPVNGVVWAYLPARGWTCQWHGYYLGIWNHDRREDQTEIQRCIGDRSHYVAKIIPSAAGLHQFLHVDRARVIRLQGFQYKTDQIRSGAGRQPSLARAGRHRAAALAAGLLRLLSAKASSQPRLR